MYPQDNNSTTAANNGKVRRAFRDVTNSSKNVDNNGVVPLKKSSTSNLSRHPFGSENVVPQQRQQKQYDRVKKPLESRDAPSVSSRGITDDISNRSRPFSSSTSSVAASSINYQHSAPADDIDARDKEDPLCATDYVEDMYSHFFEREQSTSVRPLYMEKQSHINSRMRSILVDWLVEVHLKFKLVPETLYLTVNLIDRYLELREVSRQKLQLIGVTCLLIASKYEEIYPPELRDLVYICDRAYSKEEILDMEEVVLKTLHYQITIPSAHAFLVRFLKAAHADKRMVQMACFLLDGTLQSYNLLNYLPSQLAAGAVFLARKESGRHAWSSTLLRYAHYCHEDVEPIARAILSEKAAASNELRAVNKKYSSSRYGGIAQVPISDVLNY